MAACVWVVLRSAPGDDVRDTSVSLRPRLALASSPGCSWCSLASGPDPTARDSVHCSLGRDLLRGPCELPTGQVVTRSVCVMFVTA